MVVELEAVWAFVKRHHMHICAVCAALCFVLYLLAGTVPQWYVTTPNSLHLGLFRECRGSTCQGINYPQTMNSTCGRAGSDYKSRNQASAAFLIMALITALAVVATLCVQLADWVGEGTTRTYLYLGVVIASCVSFVFVLIAVSIVGGTLDQWLYCGRTFCRMLQSTTGLQSCSWGWSFACALLALFGTLGASIVLALPLLDKLSSFRRTATWVCALILFVVFICLMVSVASPQWKVAGDRRISFGLFQSCVGSECESFDSSRMYTTPTCARNGGDLKARLSTSGSLFIIVAIVHLAGAVLFVWKPDFEWTRCVFAGMLLLLALVFLAIIVLFATTESWLYCGKRFCPGQGRGAMCGMGISFAAFMISLAIHILLIVLYGLDAFRIVDFNNRPSASPPTDPTLEREPCSERPVVQPTVGVVPSNPVRQVVGPPSSGVATHSVPLPPGHWTYHAESGYYWSAEEQLYYCHAARRYYDPERRQWYDPNTGVWA